MSLFSSSGVILLEAVHAEQLHLFLWTLVAVSNSKLIFTESTLRFLVQLEYGHALAKFINHSHHLHGGLLEFVLDASAPLNLDLQSSLVPHVLKFF